MPAFRFQIFLPLIDPEGRLINEELFEQTKSELLDRFGGLTAYSRSPAKGFWSPDDSKPMYDEIIVYEVVAEKRERKFWELLKARLEHRFRQTEIMIAVSQVELV